MNYTDLLKLFAIDKSLSELATKMLNESDSFMDACKASELVEYKKRKIVIEARLEEINKKIKEIE